MVYRIFGPLKSTFTIWGLQLWGAENRRTGITAANEINGVISLIQYMTAIKPQTNVIIKF